MNFPWNKVEINKNLKALKLISSHALPQVTTRWTVAAIIRVLVTTRCSHRININCTFLNHGLTMFVQALSMHLCFLRPGPPCLTLSKQLRHCLQSSLTQPRQLPQPLRFRAIPVFCFSSPQLCISLLLLSNWPLPHFIYLVLTIWCAPAGFKPLPLVLCACAILP